MGGKKQKRKNALKKAYLTPDQNDDLFRKQMAMGAPIHEKLKRTEKEFKFTAKSEELGIACEHVEAVFPSLVEAHLRNLARPGSSLSCQVCCANKSKPVFATCLRNQRFEERVWVCLFCGHLGCDRSSPGTHMMKHALSSIGGSHALCLNIDTGNIWCYLCDSDVSIPAQTDQTPPLLLSLLACRASTLKLVKQLEAAPKENIAPTFVTNTKSARLNSRSKLKGRSEEHT